jgi:hypothetical protein
MCACLKNSSNRLRAKINSVTHERPPIYLNTISVNLPSSMTDLDPQFGEKRLIAHCGQMNISSR